MHKRSTRHLSGLSLVEVVIAVALFGLCMVSMTQAMLRMNKNTALSRMRTLAKSAAMGRIQEAISVPYSPSATPAVNPTLLQVGKRTEAIELSDSTSGIGRIPATMEWEVKQIVSGTAPTVSVRCTINYRYFGRPQTYELNTFRASDN